MHAKLVSLSPCLTQVEDILVSSRNLPQSYIASSQLLITQRHGFINHKRDELS